MSSAWNGLRTFSGRGLQSLQTGFRSTGPALRRMASRLPQLIRFAPAGAAGLGAGGAGQLGVGGGTTATATGTGGGLAVAGAKVVAAFAVGFGVGIGLAKAQEAVLPKGYTTPDLLARGFKAACGEPTQGFLDWGDKYLSWLP